MYFEYFIFVFRSYSFGIETINTFILMYADVLYSKPVPNSSVFRPKRPKNPTLRGGTHLYGLYERVTPSRVLTPFMIVRDRDQV